MHVKDERNKTHRLEHKIMIEFREIVRLQGGCNWLRTSSNDRFCC